MNTVNIMIITGRELKRILDTYEARFRIILEFITDNGNDYYCRGWVFKRTALPPFDPIVLAKDSASIPLNIRPYILATLRWRFKETADDNIPIDEDADYYLIPGFNGSYVVYKFSPIPLKELLQKIKIPGYPDGITIPELKDLDNKVLMKVLKAVYKMLAGATFNPVPPKLVP